jgi:hypothetical protein
MHWAWEMRGLIDWIIGGVGMRRGRRDPQNLRIGDALDFWRVESVEPNHLLRLRAEMKVPGKAWLQFQVTPAEEGQILLTQTAFFAPKGLFGWLYWYALYPITWSDLQRFNRPNCTERRLTGLPERSSQGIRHEISLCCAVRAGSASTRMLLWNKHT